MTTSSSSFNVENSLMLFFLLALSAVYLYLLLSPTQPKPSEKPRSFVVQPDTLENFEKFMKEYEEEHNYKSWGNSTYDDIWTTSKFKDDYSSRNKDSFGAEGSQRDDFFLDAYGGGSSSAREKEFVLKPNQPSSKFRCQLGWVTIRSETNYRYLWMHTGTDYWMSATATMDTPLHRKAFRVEPVNGTCTEGWVILKEGDTQGYLTMVPPGKPEEVIKDEWVVKVGTDVQADAMGDQSYHFLLEEEGYLLNRGALAFINVFSQNDYSVRGHTASYDRSRAAGREYGAMVRFQFVNESEVLESIAEEEAEYKKAAEEDKSYIDYINKLPPSSENRYISFGLYGNNPKYTAGAIENTKLAKIYYPGWKCRFYVTSDVIQPVRSELLAQGAEISDIPAGQGYIAGMFWRFLVASDPSVDRYVIRDVDSRLNARDRIAVEDWIRSKEKIHIMRDHVNHCFPINGGMWGGVKGALPYMKERLDAWTRKDEYAADLHFLEDQIWPDIQHSHIAHDSYCCDRYPNTKPFPTRRPATYQHVGQVFDGEGNPRLADIDGFIRGVPTPNSCRKKADWIYG